MSKKDKKGIGCIPPGTKLHDPIIREHYASIGVDDILGKKIPKSTPIVAEIRIVANLYAVYIGNDVPREFWDLDQALAYIRDNLKPFQGGVNRP